MAENTPRLLAGRYEVGDLIGRGGMAEVHIGRDTRLGRTVAIKVLRSDLARDPAFQTRFRREAQAAAALNHPSIVAVYDTGEDVSTDAQGQPFHLPFIVMEYVEGHTVRELLREGSALPIDEAIEITIGVLTALQYSHHAGIVHRDIKPANVMITQTGAVKVMDFGIARALADSAATMTQTQAVIGTAQYLSPEQARGEAVDTRSDLYSTGCLLYELLTGRPPFIGDSAVAVAYQHVREEAPPPSAYAQDVPEVLDRITLKALAKDRDLRYSSAAEFKADLESAARGGLVSAPAVGATAVMGATSETQVLGATAATQALTEIPPEEDLLPTAEQEEEDEKAKKRKKMWIIIGIIAGVLVIGLVVWFAAFANGGGDKKPTAPTMVSVPQVTQGMTADGAQTALTDAKLTPKAGGEEPSDTVPKGQVTRFDPKSGEKVKVNSTVQYFVSSGPDTVTVPPGLVGMSQSDAQQAIQDAGLKVGNVTTGDSPTVAQGVVISSDPASGTSVAKNSTVDLVVSTGQTTVPNLVGKNQTDAASALKDAGLTLGNVTEKEDDQAAAGTVLSQSPAANQKVNQNSSVDIVVAKATTKVKIPDLTNASQEAALSTLKSLGLNPTINPNGGYSSTVPAGYVLSTSPPANTEVAPGSSVTIFLSQGGASQSPAPDQP